MNKKNWYKVILVSGILLLIGGVIRVLIDYYLNVKGINSSLFSIDELIDIFVYIGGAVAAFIVAVILKKKYGNC